MGKQLCAQERRSDNNAREKTSICGLSQARSVVFPLADAWITPDGHNLSVIGQNDFQAYDLCMKYVADRAQRCGGKVTMVRDPCKVQ